MKYSLALILIIAVGLCRSNCLICQTFHSSEKILQQFCDNGTISENCSKDSVTPIGSSQVNQLKIGGCYPGIVLDSVKQFQTNLRAVDISHSRYTDLKWFSVKLNKLQTFNASHNKLSDLRLLLLLNFPEIIEIDLSYNNITHIDWRDFSSMNLPKLRKLHLSHNSLIYVTMLDFPLQSIEYIDLTSNHIQYILTLPSKQYKNLKELHLEENPFFEINCDLLDDMFNGRLTSLFLSWKNLQRFQGSCMGACKEKQMRIIRINGTSEGIFITSSGKYEIHCREKCFENVYYFNAGCNNFQNGNEVIQNIGSNVYHMNLSGNFIGKISASAFYRFSEMKVLELSRTNLTWFDFDMLQNQKNTIQYIDISNNNLKVLYNIAALRGLIKLQDLIMGGNQIENAYEIIEYLNPSTISLDLSEGNVIGKVNVATFQKLTELQRLNLSNTNLTLPDSNPFETLQNLAILDLSHNNLENFNFSIISTTLYNLAELRLAGCKIKDITVFETVIQYLGPYISKLDLSGNAAHRSINSLNFDLNSLKFQQYLEFLDISNNNLETIDFNSFPFDNYIHINLEGNDLIELTNLHKGYSRWWRTKLEVENNQFPCLYLKQLKTDYVSEIYLAGNSWHQKPDIDCRTTSQSINDFLTNVYDTIKFW